MPVRPDFARAITKVESGGDPNAVSEKGAIGLNQIMPETGAEMGYTREQLFDPQINNEARDKYLDKLDQQFGGNEYLMAAGFNGGPRRVQRWLNGEVQNLPAETQRYVAKVAGRLSQSGAEDDTDGRYLKTVQDRQNLDLGQAVAAQYPDVANQIVTGSLPPTKEGGIPPMIFSVGRQPASPFGGGPTSGLQGPAAMTAEKPEPTLKIGGREYNYHQLNTLLTGMISGGDIPEEAKGIISTAARILTGGEEAPEAAEGMTLSQTGIMTKSTGFSPEENEQILSRPLGEESRVLLNKAGRDLKPGVTIRQAIQDYPEIGEYLGFSTPESRQAEQAITSTAKPLTTDEINALSRETPPAGAPGGTGGPPGGGGPPITLTPEQAVNELAEKQAAALRTVKVGKGVAQELGRPDLAQVVSEQETLAQARALRHSVESVYQMPMEEPKLRVEVAALADVINTEAKGIHDQAVGIMGKANDGQNVDADLENLANRFGAFAVQASRLAGMRSAAGRALDILNPLKPENLRTIETMKLAQQLNAGNNPAELLEAINRLTADRLSRLGRNIAEGNQAQGSLSGGIMEYYRANLLSNPQTIGRIGLSNLVTLMSEIPIRALAARMPGDAVKVGEASKMMRGIYDGFWESMRYGGEVAMSGNADYMNNGIQYAERPAAITSEGTRLEGTPWGKAIDYLGGAVRLPFRGIAGIHQFGRAMAYSAEMHAQAWRAAVDEAAESATGVDARSLAEQLYREKLSDQTPEMIEAAKNFGDTTTFINELGKWGQKAQGLLDATPGARVIWPFFRVPVNIEKYGLDYVPGINVATQWSALKAGGAARQVAEAKLAASAVMSGVVAMGCLRGDFTGGGSLNAKAQQALRNEGWLPYSMHVGGKYVEIPEPFRTPIGIICDATELSEHVDDTTRRNMATVAALTAGRALSNFSAVQGLANIREAYESMISQKATAVEAFQRWAGRTASGFVPMSSLLHAVTHGATVPNPFDLWSEGIKPDPSLREARTWFDQIKAGTPHFSKELPPFRDLYANVVPTLPGVPANLLYPTRVTTEKPNDVDAEIDDVFGDAAPSAFPKAPNWLTPNEADRWTVLRGEGLYNDLHDLIKTEGYKGMANKIQKGVLLSDVVKDHTQYAMARLLGEDAHVQQEWRAQQAQQEVKAGRMTPQQAADLHIGAP